MFKQFNFHISKPLLHLLVAIGLFLTTHLSAVEKISIEISPNADTVKCGEVLVTNVTIKETDTTGFGRTQNVSFDGIEIALLNGWNGYKFANYDSIISYGADLKQPWLKDDTFKEDTIQIQFIAKDWKTQDSVVVFGLRLEPIPSGGSDVYTYSGTMTVSVDTFDANAIKFNQIKDTTSGNYMMAQPEITFTGDTLPCPDSSYTFQIGVNNIENSLANGDSLKVLYRSANDSIILYNDTLLNSNTIPISIDSLHEDFDSIEIKINHKNGWVTDTSIALNLSRGCGPPVDISITPPDTLVGYGDTLTISRLVVKENYDWGFGNKQGSSDFTTITVDNNINGYKLIKYDDLTWNNINGDSDSDFKDTKYPKIKDFQDKSFKVDFLTKNNAANIDSIVITNLKLAPMENSSSYGGKLHVLVDTNDISNAPSMTPAIVKVDSSGIYSMATPKLKYEFDKTKYCTNEAFDFDISFIGDKGTISGNDSITVVYCHNTDNTLNDTLYNKELSSNPLAQIHIDKLKKDYDSIKVHVQYESGWTADSIITIGEANTNIIRHKLPTIELLGEAKNGLVNVSVLIADLDLKQFFSTPDSLYIDLSPLYIGNDTVFHPNLAGKGITNIELKAISRTSDCEIIKILQINVIPDIISLEDTYCYVAAKSNLANSSNNVDTVEVALTALKAAYTVSSHNSDNIESNIRFNSLTLVYGGNIIDTLNLEDSTSKSDDNFLKFAFNSSGIIKEQLKSEPKKGEHIDIIFKLNIDVETIITNNDTIEVDTSLQEGSEAFGWSCDIKSEDDSKCTCTKETTDTSIAFVNIESQLTTIAAPKENGYLVDLNTGYCQNRDSLMLNPNQTVDTIYGGGIVYHDNYYFKPDTFPSGLNSNTTIYYKYYDENRCSGDTTYKIQIYAVPEVAFNTDRICEDSTQEFSQYSPDAALVNINRWEWDFGDGFSISNLNDASKIAIDGGTHGGKTMGTYQEPGHIYASPGEKTISLTVMSDKGCTNFRNDSVIVIGKKPTPKFTFSGKLQKKAITLKNSTEAEEYDPVNSYVYQITKPSKSNVYTTVENKDDFTFMPDEKGVYTVALKAITGNGCESSTDTLIPVFPIIKVTDELLYDENFTQDGNDTMKGWLLGDQYINTLQSSWKRMEVSGIFKDDNYHSEGDMWVVGAPSDSLNNETSWLESPCFDLSELNFPMISLDLMQSLEEGRDGAAIYYTLNDGDSWERLGETGVGANWYNASGIYSKPGVDAISHSINEGAQGWSFDTTGWITARYPLDIEAKASNGSATGCIRFRIAYNSNNFHDSAFAGLGVDNFSLGKRSRVVLLEQFINSTYDETVASGDYVYNADDLNAFVDSFPREVVDIRYHNSTSSAKDDLFNVFNSSQDNDIRAMAYHARDCGSLWAMDGQSVVNKVNCTPQNISYEDGFVKRALVSPAFDIYDVKLEKEDNSLKITATIKKISSLIDERLGVHDHKVRMAIVQREYTHTNGKVYRNVLIDLLSKAENGDYVATLSEFEKGDSITLTAHWTPVIKTEGNDYRLIIFVQGRDNYHEVEQVWFNDLGIDLVPQTANKSGFSGISSITSLGNMKVYPNPANNVLNIVSANELNSGATWSIYNISGQAIKQGRAIFDQQETSLDVSDLKDGLYILQMKDEKNGQFSCKFSILKN